MPRRQVTLEQKYMIKHIWSIVCQKSVIDQETNNLSINDVLERIDIETLAPLPNDGTAKLPITFEVVSYWYREQAKKDEKRTVEVCIFSPQNNLLNSFEQEIPLTQGMDRLRSRLRVQGVPVTTSGVYKVALREKGVTSEVITEIPIEIILKTK